MIFFLSLEVFLHILFVCSSLKTIGSMRFWVWKDLKSLFFHSWAIQTFIFLNDQLCQGTWKIASFRLKGWFGKFLWHGWLIQISLQRKLSASLMILLTRSIIYLKSEIFIIDASTNSSKIWPSFSFYFYVRVIQKVTDELKVFAGLCLLSSRKPRKKGIEK